MKKILFFAAVAFVLSAAAISGYAFHQQSQIDPAILANLAALSNSESTGGSEGGSNYEYPDGYMFDTLCGVKISSSWFSPRCKVTVIICQGGGYGCNSRKCPVHR